MGWRGHGSRGALALTRRHSASPPVQDGATPLYIASQEGQLEVVKALIERRADVEAKTNVSSTSGTHAQTHTRVRSTSRHLHVLAHERERARMLCEL